MKMEYITKDRALEIVVETLELTGEEWIDLWGAFNTEPEEDVAQIVHGEWKPCWLKGFETQHIKCSACGFTVPFYERTVLNYCPQCGAKMIGDTVG